MKLTNRWIIAFLILPHLSIYYFNRESIVMLVYVWQSIIIFVAFIVLMKTKKIDYFNLLLIITMLLVLVSSYWNGVLTNGIIFSIGVFCSLCIYISYATSDFRELISGLYYICISIIIVNFVTVLFPDIDVSTGHSIYLIGGKNQFAMTIALVIPVIYLHSMLFYGKMKNFSFFIIALSLISTYMAGSATGVVLVLLSTAFIVWPKRALPSFFQLIIFYLIMFFTVIIYRMQEVLFGNFITNILKKDLTFTYRTYIWDQAIESFKNAWFLGSGRGNYIIYESLPYLQVNEVHNGLLQILLDTGVVGLIPIIFIFLIIAEQIEGNRQDVATHILSFFVFIYLMIGLSESAYFRKEFWILLTLSYCLSNIVKQMSSEKHQIHLDI